MCLPSDAHLQHLPSYLGFSYLGRGVSFHRCASKVQPLLLTLDEGYLLTAALPDLQRGIAPLGPPVPAQPQCGVGPPSRRPYLGRGVTPLITAPDLGRWISPLGRTSDLGRGAAPLGRSCAIAVWYSGPLPLTLDVG